MTEDEKELRDIYFSKYPEASPEDVINFVLDVYTQDEKWEVITASGVTTGLSLRSFRDEIEERIV